MIDKDTTSKINQIAEEQLAIRGLSKEKVEAYTSIEELESSLQRLEDLKNIVQLKGINDFLKDIDADVIKNNNYYDIKEVGRIATEIFLSRKQLIVGCISHLKNQTLKSLIEKLPEKVETQEIKQLVKQLIAQTQTLQKESIDKEKQEAELKILLHKQQIDIDIMERRSKIYLSFLAKESLASIIGFVLLLIIMIAQLIAMFYPNFKTTEVLNNTFLIVLGYFFGQSASELKDKKN